MQVIRTILRAITTLGARRQQREASRATIRRLEMICRLHPDELAARLGAGKERS